MDYNKTGQLIARRRKVVGLTQKELAGYLGVTNKAVSKWETGGGLPDVGMLRELCRILEISVDELMDGEQRGTGGGSDGRGMADGEEARRRKKRKTAGIVCAIPALILVCMQLVYVIAGKAYQMEYISDFLPYLVTMLLILLLAAAAILFFWAARCALEENDKQYAVNRIDVTRNITHMEMLAGDMYDCLVQIDSTDVYSDPYTNEEEEMDTAGDLAYFKLFRVSGRRVSRWKRQILFYMTPCLRTTGRDLRSARAAG